MVTARDPTHVCVRLDMGGHCAPRMLTYVPIRALAPTGAAVPTQDWTRTRVAALQVIPVPIVRQISMNVHQIPVRMEPHVTSVYNIMIVH